VRFARLCVSGSGLLLAGCGAAADAPHRMLVTDSAGVRMVQLMDVSFHAGGPEWRVSDRPDVIIGRVSGAREYLLDQVMAVERLSDGRWVLADMGSSQVRYYDARGRHLQSVGRRGEGPGEFRQIMRMSRLAGDTLVVDDAHVRLQILDESGRLVAATPPTGSISAARTQPVAAFRDGELVAMSTPAAAWGQPEVRELFVTYHRARMRSSAAGAAELMAGDTIGTWMFIRLSPGPRGPRLMQFHQPPQVGVASDALVVADAMSYEVRIYQRDGSLRSVTRFDWPRREISPADMDRAREAYVALGAERGPVPEPLRQQRAEDARSFEFASHMPAFAALLIDSDDHIWLREYVPNEATVGTWDATRAPVETSRWIVLRPDGGLAARVTLPGRFRPTVIGEDFVAGLYRDEMDVEYVHSYRLQRR
jgi:hypothetical protein